MRSIFASILLLIISSASVRADMSETAVQLVAAARAQVGVTLTYDPSYQQIAYPMGDVPPVRGVCSDVVIRAFRAVGIDLQQEVHRDMKQHFAAYPKNWGLSAPDPNIDHRRVPNLTAWFTRHGYALPFTQNATDYQPGDVVAWVLDDGRPHIGIVSDRLSADGARPLILHNIGWGAREEDVLFNYRISGHFRVF